MGFQFVHVQTFSRKPNTKGQSTGFVFGEAMRRSGCCEHVEKPIEPVTVFGKTIGEVEQLHDSMSAEAMTPTKAGKIRKIRNDQHTLLTVVASHPSAPGESPQDVEAWQARTIEWMKDVWGDRLQSVIRHDDESHVHVHAYLLPDDPEMKARGLHPGVVAKDAARLEAESAGQDPKAANKIGDVAYKKAMRALQDSYFEKVGIASGLSRLGPGRRRLTRDAWKAEQAQVVHASTAIAAAQAATIERDSTVAGLRATAERARAYVAAARAAADQAKAAADAQAAKAAAARAAADQAKRQAAAIIAQARKEANQVVAKAERRAARLSRIGERLGGLWSGLSGVQRRFERAAAERISKAEARAAGALAEAKMVVRSEFGGELDRLKADADRLKAAVTAARAAESAATAECGRERSGRLVAETQREDFRGRWSDADNENISLRKALGRNF